MRRVLDGVPEPKKWLKYREFGTSPDILAIDQQGRLIVAEAKPPGYTAGIVKGPIQARFYAGLVSRWLERDPDASEVLRRMLEQRIQAGLTRPPAVLPSQPLVVPVLAIGSGVVSNRALEHSMELREALANLDPEEAGATEPTEIWRLKADGNMEARI